MLSMGRRTRNEALSGRTAGGNLTSFVPLKPWQPGEAYGHFVRIIFLSMK